MNLAKQKASELALGGAGVKQVYFQIDTPKNAVNESNETNNQFGLSLNLPAAVSAPKASTGAANPSTQACLDSDGGINLDVAGVVTYNGQSYADVCSGLGSSTGITEYYCSRDAKATSAASCPSGKVCSNGACVASSSGGSRTSR